MINIIDVPLFALFSLFFINLFDSCNTSRSQHSTSLPSCSETACESGMKGSQFCAPQMISDDTRGKGCVLKLSWVSILHSITLNFDWIYDMHFVYRGKTKHLQQALTNVLHAAIFKYGSQLEVSDGMLCGLGLVSTIWYMVNCSDANNNISQSIII